MGRKKSPFLSALGVFWEIWRTLVAEVLDHGGSDDDLRRIKDDASLRRAIADLIIEAGRKAREVAEKLLQFITTVSVFGAERFVAVDHFKVDTSDGAVVKVADLGANFRQWLLGKIEEGVAPATLKIHRLTKASLDDPILEALGEGNCETTLTYLFNLLKKQSKGEEGVLLVNGYANIFYIRDVKGTLFAVNARWIGHGWLVNACSVTHPFGWSGGRQFVSR